MTTRGNTGRGFRWRTLFSGLIPLFVLAHLGHHLLTALPIPLIPMIREEFSLDYARSGMVLSAFSLAYGLAQIPAGWVTDRVGPRTMITVGICGVAVAGGLIGLAPTYAVLLALLALMGVMGGTYHPAAPPMISASVEPSKRGRALGLHIIGGSGAYFLSPLLGAALAASLGWRGAFLVLSVVAFAFGVFFFFRLGRITAQRATTGAARVEDEPAEPGWMRRLVLFITIGGFAQIVAQSLLAFAPLMLVDRMGFSKEGAAAFMAIYFSTGLWAGPLGGYFSDRVGSVPLVLGVCFLAIPVVFALGVTTNSFLFGVLLVLVGVVSYVRMPVSELYIVSHTPAARRSAILGIYYFATMEGSGILTPVMGYLIDNVGFLPTYAGGAIAILVVVSVCTPLLLRSRK